MKSSLCDFLASHDIQLEAGEHSKREGLCALEAESMRRRLNKTDDPIALNTWDSRAINDIPVSRGLRTPWMCKLADTYRDCRDWSVDRQKQVAERIVTLSVQQIIALLALPYRLRAQCSSAATLNEAVTVAQAVGALWSENTIYTAEAGWAAESAVEKVRQASYAASAKTAAWVAWAVWAACGEWGKCGEVAESNVFITACKVWIDAAK